MHTAMTPTNTYISWLQQISLAVNSYFLIRWCRLSVTHFRARKGIIINIKQPKQFTWRKVGSKKVVVAVVWLRFLWWDGDVVASHFQLRLHLLSSAANEYRLNWFHWGLERQIRNQMKTPRLQNKDGKFPSYWLENWSLALNPLTLPFKCEPYGFLRLFRFSKNFILWIRSWLCLHPFALTSNPCYTASYLRPTHETRYAGKSCFASLKLPLKLQYFPLLLFPGTVHVL